ncbi:hypothetical protein [Nitriliruptor alkaliphilus]|uniref:hypothetical protein n=1 Tax=Nitriliruptor alkaliphilus TaxID=427918 RepID=UPI00069824BE|nr:hypothetical protein [Nitriliruptor alkaliphilus]
MSAGQVWRRPDGSTWVEVQAKAMEPSGWRLAVPLVDAADAPDAPPLVVTVGRWRARTHLVTALPAERLGEPLGELPLGQITAIRTAAAALLDVAAAG